MSFLFWYFALINLVAFSIIAVDKQLAVNQKRRISELNLLLPSVIGGTIGSGLAMLLFRHKTSKESFLLRFYGIIVIQILILFGLYNFGIIKF
ncbi:DUF1294 domain-containing protein [Flavobacterium sp. RSP49]|uniref:DUF1294 domain-containing protein n=1 Tax=Flavobacterium bomense TaxID=2497483 RepID=A0A432CQZ6_9FLAO|nr:MULTISPECIES: DUF1294 domain-containing protein [Flavobacterium]RTY96361.1 DUF1294 domain-containing protein [Flavobacterium sp. GSN2]RTY70373.1 DUF1294 domain-containing protein [Flavobacterium sp. LB2P53]RTY76335.1 DUF1294 domain-containing protein [Flavobacterium sp. LS1R10]RTY99090.1 DUF1294 domain-containing protein [Flavobacterium sp. RSP49]RTZ08030.1 DUF1294 domain-containing protein [Flavobacterium bomense]